MQSPGAKEAEEEDSVPLFIMEDAHLFDFTEPNAFADAILVVEENELYASRYLLASVSSVFSEMFSSDTQTCPHRIPLPDDSVEDIQKMLAWMMPTTRTSLSDGDYERLVHVAFKYDIRLLLQECEKQLVLNFEGGTQCDNTRLAYLVIAQNYELGTLRECSMQYFSRMKLSELKSLPNFDQLQRDTLFDINERRVVHLESSTEEAADAINLIVEGKAIPASRATLSAASPVFGAMLSSSFREGTAKDIPLPGKSYQHVKYMVDFISLHDYLPLTDLLLDGMVQMADEYQIGKLKKHCEIFMVDALAVPGATTTENMLRYFLLSQKYNIPTVVKSTEGPLVKTRMNTLARFRCYKETDMCAIFHSRVLLLESSLNQYFNLTKTTLDTLESGLSAICNMAGGGSVSNKCDNKQHAIGYGRGGIPQKSFQSDCAKCNQILVKTILDKKNDYFNVDPKRVSLKDSCLLAGTNLLSSSGLS